MAKSDPTKWLECAAHIRGLGRGVNDRKIAPMFEKLAARLEEIALAKAEAQMKASDHDKGAVRGPQRRGKSGGKLDVGTRSEKDEQESPRRIERRSRPRP